MLTAEGRAVLAAASKPHAELVEALYVAYLGDDLAASADGLQRVADHLRAHWRGVGCGEQCVLDGWRPTTS